MNLGTFDRAYNPLMLSTLHGKTFLLLGTQLLITWLTTVVLIGVARDLHHAGVSWVAGGANDDGDLDLHLDWGVVYPYFFAALAVQALVFEFLLNIGMGNLYIGVPLFTIWSVLTGIGLALCLLSVDENIGSKVLALTALITIAAGLIGTYSGVDFSFLRFGLFASLLLLIIFGLIRIFFSIPRWIQRIGAFFGVVVFTGYLLYDFNRLDQLSNALTSNTWLTAMHVTLSIYLGIINLLYSLLDLLS